jgi:hypothetical protein
MRRWVVGQIGRLGSGERIPGLSPIGDRWFKIKKAEDYFVKQKGEEGDEGRNRGKQVVAEKLGLSLDLSAISDR